MKKEYVSPIVEIIKLDDNDIIVTSTYDPNSILDENADSWFS